MMGARDDCPRRSVDTSDHVGRLFPPSTVYCMHLTLPTSGWAADLLTPGSFSFITPHSRLFGSGVVSTRKVKDDS